MKRHATQERTQARIKKRLAESYDRAMARVIEQTRNAECSQRITGPKDFSK